MLSDDYIMGFTEGEGCFSITIQKWIDRKPRQRLKKSKVKRPSLGFRVTPNFRITAVQDEEAVLRAIRERLGVGEIYVQDRGKKYPNSRAASHYYVQTKADIDKVIDFFKDKKFYTSKGESFRLWLKCVEIMKSGRHLTKEGLLEICELRDRMNFRKYKNVRKTDEVRKLLELSLEHIETHAKQTTFLHNESSPELQNWIKKRQGNHRPGNLTQNTPETP